MKLEALTVRYSKVQYRGNLEQVYVDGRVQTCRAMGVPPAFVGYS